MGTLLRSPCPSSHKGARQSPRQGCHQGPARAPPAQGHQGVLVPHHNHFSFLIIFPGIDDFVQILGSGSFPGCVTAGGQCDRSAGGTWAIPKVLGLLPSPQSQGAP